MVGGVCVLIESTSVYWCLGSWSHELSKVCDFGSLRNSTLFGPHAAAIASNARAHISFHGRDSRAFVLVHYGLQLSIATACPNPGMIGHANSACFATIFFVEQGAFRSLLLAHSPPAKYVTKDIQEKKCVLAEGVRAPLNI